MSRFKIVNTDNYGGDYPDESFLCASKTDSNSAHLSYLHAPVAQSIADALNKASGPEAPRWWKVVPADYTLQPGFEP